MVNPSGLGGIPNLTPTSGRINSPSRGGINSPPALQQYDVRAPLQAFRAGFANTEAINQNFLRNYVGSTMASSSPLEAANAAFMGGDVQTGIDLQNLPMEKLEALVDWIPKAAQSAATEEQFNMLLQKGQEAGLGDFAEYMDPSEPWETRRARLMGEAEELRIQIKDVGGETPGSKVPTAFTFDQRGNLVNRQRLGEAVLPEAVGSGYKDKGEVARIEGGLRKEFTTISKDFIKVRDAYRRIQASAKDASAAGDLALIFNYMKVLDPGSTVREGEFATAQNSAGVPQRIVARYNQIISGARLSQEQRKDFLKRGGMLFAKQRTQHKKTVTQYGDIAKRLQLSVKNVIPDFSSAEAEKVSKAPTEMTDEELLRQLEAQ